MDQMKAPRNFQEHCRACLQYSSEMRSLLSASREVVNIRAMYTSLNNFQLEINAGTPAKICRICEEKLTAGFNFKIQCLESEERIRNYNIPLAMKIEPDSDNGASDIEYDCPSESKSKLKREPSYDDDHSESEDLGPRRSELEKFPADQVREAIEELKRKNEQKLKELRQCIICPGTSNFISNVKGLSLHMSASHSDIKNWCSTCNKLIDGNLEDHKDRHSEEEDTCKLCHKELRRKGLLHHLKLHAHAGDEFVCNICKKIFTQKHYLDAHLRRHRTDENTEALMKEKGELLSAVDKSRIIDTRSNDCKQIDMIANEAAEKMLLKDECKSEGEENKVSGDSKSTLAARAWKTIEEFRRRHTECLFCTFKTDKMKCLVLHVVKSHKEIKNWCSSCNEVISENYQEHKNVHLNERLKCPYCPSKVKKSYYVEHLKTHAGIERLSCELCGKKFAAVRLLKAHLKRHVHGSRLRKVVKRKKVSSRSRNKQDSADDNDSDSDSNSNCRDSDEDDDADKVEKVIKTIIKLDYRNIPGHVKNPFQTQVNQFKRYPCNICSKRFTRNTTLRMHVSRQHTSRRQKSIYFPTKEERTHGCDVCGKFFTRNRTLKMHRARHTKQELMMAEKMAENSDSEQKVTSEEKITYECHTCSKTFTKKRLLAFHMTQHAKKDAKKVEHKCSYCGRVCQGKAQLKEHERIHTGEKPYICNVCGKGCRQRGTLTTHMKIHSEKQVGCHLCEKKFCTTGELRLHLLKHTGEKPFLCSECGKSYTRKALLNAHIRIHTGETPYKCNLCGESFRLSSTLRSHLLTHTNYKPLQCPHCSYSCRKRYSLKQHMKRHSVPSAEEQQHVCQVCGYAFSTKISLQLHMTSVHYTIL